jgi:hypothetical protein
MCVLDVLGTFASELFIMQCTANCLFQSFWKAKQMIDLAHADALIVNPRCGLDRPTVLCEKLRPGECRSQKGFTVLAKE